MGDNEHDRLATIVGEVLDAGRLELGTTYTSSPAIFEALTTILAMSIEAGNHPGDEDIRTAARHMAHNLREDILAFVLDCDKDLFV